jgi:hypothetical protein
VVKPVPTPFIPGQDPIKEKRMKKQEYNRNVQTASVSSVPPSPDSIPLLRWPIRTLSVKLVNQISGIFQVLRRFPARSYVVVTGPLDEIMQLPIEPPRVEYAVDFPFLCFLDYHRVWF